MSINSMKIAFDGETVTLRWEDRTAGGVDKHDWSCDEMPTPAFRASLAAFAGYVLDVIEAPPEWSEDLEIRQLTLKEEDNGARGLIVTALRKCKKAHHRTLLVNTPYMAEPPEGYNGDGDGYLSETILALIDEAIAQATKYREGERGEQTELALQSENAKAFDDRAAAAAVASTRKPKRGRPPKASAGLAVMNPDATEVLTDDALRQLLLMVERDVPLDAITQWTSSQRDAAERWARTRQKELAGALKELEQVPDEPACVQLAATLPLTAEQWTQPAPALSGEGVEAIRAAADGGQ